MKKDNDSIGASVNDWAAALQKEGLFDIAKNLYEDSKVKEKGLEDLKKFDLPRLNFIKMPLKEFFSDQKNAFRNLDSKKYYVNLISKNLPRLRAINLNKQEIISFIKKSINERKISEYTLILSEYYENLYGGNSIIDSKGNLILELAQGSHGDVVTGKSIPLFLVEMKGEKSLKIYENQKNNLVPITDNKIKKAILKTIAYIVGTKQYGYFEFVFAKKSLDKELSPIFIDYRDKEIYQITESNR